MNKIRLEHLKFVPDSRHFSQDVGNEICFEIVLDTTMCKIQNVN